MSKEKETKEAGIVSTVSETAAAVVTDDDGKSVRFITNPVVKRCLFALAVLFTLFHLYSLCGLFPQINVMAMYAVHWAGGLALAFMLYPAVKKSSRHKVPVYDWLFALMSLAVAVYVIINCEKLQAQAVMNGYSLTDLIFGAAAILLTLEAGRRTIGRGLPIVSIVLLLYAMFGNYIPGWFSCKGYTLKRTITYVFSLDGLFSTPVKMSFKYIFLLVLFGVFLEVTGAGGWFMRLATALTGKSRGGPAKVAVASSCLFGSVSGSAVANVVSTGTFTIPLMKKSGYRSEFAGAVEAVASTGGQIMPPVMGSGAFIMAESTGIPYGTICLAALVPALLYYFSCFISIDLEAMKYGIKGLDDCEKPKRVFVEGWYYALPILTLIYFIAIAQISVTRSALYAIIAAILAGAIKKESRISLKQFFKVLETGAVKAVTIITAVSCAGIAIGAVMLTGLGIKFTYVVSQLAEGSMFLSLLFAALACTVMGMGLPTVAAYVIGSAMLATGLIGLGLEPISAHMFIFYYCILSNITPPVALAAYAGANLARADFGKTAACAMRIGLVAFIIPFFFAYSPAILMIGAWYEIVLAVISSIIGVYALTVAQYGWFAGDKLPVVLRLMLFVAAGCLIYSGILTDILGYGLIILFVFLHKATREKILHGKMIKNR